MTDAQDPPGDHDRAVASVRSGQPFTSVLVEDAGRRASALDALISAVADLETRFVRVGNPLRAPLTMERLLIQASGADGELLHGDDPAALTRLLATPQGDEARVILVVEQAETLDPVALATLQSMAPHFSDRRPRLQVIFSGAPAFQTLLEGGAAPPPPAVPPMLVPDAPLPLLDKPSAFAEPVPVQPVPVEPAPVEPAPVEPAPVELAPVPQWTTEPLPPLRRRRWRIVVPLALLALLLAAAATLRLVYRDVPLGEIPHRIGQLLQPTPPVPR